MKSKRAGFFIVLLTTMLGAACNGNSSRQVSSGSESVPAKRYHLKGKVVSIDARAKMANIDSEAIPGFMDAMTMPYRVKPESELEQLHPGDSIAGELVMQDDSGWLEHITIVAHGTP